MRDWKTNPLESYREQINAIDDEILILLKRRMQLVKKVVMYKKQNDMEIYVPQREIEILTRLTTKAHEMGIGDGFIRNLFQNILEESKKTQQNFLDEKNSR